MSTDAEKLSVAVARLNRRLRQERQSELTPTQLSVLGTLAQSGPISPSAVAIRERVSAPSATKVLNYLADNGFVERTDNPDDKRQVIVTVSKAGKQALEAERRRRDAWLQLNLKGLDARERALLREAAAVMTRIAES